MEKRQVRQCEARKADGLPCKGWALRGEKYCLSHSQSQRAKDIRKARAENRMLSRENMMRDLMREFKNLDVVEDVKERVRLKTILTGQIVKLRSEIEKLDELEALIKEKGNGEV
jgi:hypothetical protein